MVGCFACILFQKNTILIYMMAEHDELMMDLKCAKDVSRSSTHLQPVFINSLRIQSHVITANVSD